MKTMKKTEGKEIYEPLNVNHNQSGQSQPTDIDITGKIEEVKEESTIAVHDPHHRDGVNGIQQDEGNEVITVNSYSKYTPEQIRAQMVKTVVEDPLTISTFADPDFQKLISMANRTFIVPNIGEVLEERFQKEQMELTNKLAENPFIYDIFIFPLTISEKKYVILELAYFCKNGQFVKHLLDYFSPNESAMHQNFLSNKIREKIKEFKMEGQIGGVFIWDSEFSQLRSEISKTLLIQQQTVDKHRANIGLAFMDVKKELSEIQQIFNEDQPEFERIMASLCNHYEIELTRLGKLMEKWRLYDTEVRTKIGPEFYNNEETIAYCQHIKPKHRRNLLKFSRMDSYTEVVLEIVSCLEGSRKIPRKKTKLNLKTIPSCKKDQLLIMLKECQTLVETGMETYELFKALSDKIINNEPVQYPNSKPFLEAASKATTTANAKPHLWVIAAFLRIWGESRNTPA